MVKRVELDYRLVQMWEWLAFVKVRRMGSLLDLLDLMKEHKLEWLEIL